MPLTAAPIQEQLRDLPPFRLRAEPRTLHFRKPATTSRGALTHRHLICITATSGQHTGIGESSPIPGLSKERTHDIAALANSACRQIETWQTLPADCLTEAPSLRFGIETALLNMKAASGPVIWDTPFTRGETGIAIHHLIWMSDLDTTRQNLQEGAQNGAPCLKCKVGALPFSEELQLLKETHQRYPGAELRVDANGAFCPRQAASKLEALAEAGVSIIEQPIAPGQWAALKQLIRHSPLPIALDEELIAPGTRSQREQLLDTLTPAALVIKPTLHGGLIAAEEWASIAEERHIRWWSNSAMESHIGHSALVQWSALRAPATLHGLGTGQLFSDDTSRNIRLENHHLYWQFT